MATPKTAENPLACYHRQLVKLHSLLVMNGGGDASMETTAAESEVGLKLDQKFSSSAGSQGYLYSAPNRCEVVVAFRGTTSATKDFIADLDGRSIFGKDTTDLKGNKVTLNVRRGFYDAAEDYAKMMQGPLQASLEKLRKSGPLS